MLLIFTCASTKSLPLKSPRRHQVLAGASLVTPWSQAQYHLLAVPSPWLLCPSRAHAPPKLLEWVDITHVIPTHFLVPLKPFNLVSSELIKM